MAVTATPVFGQTPKTYGCIVTAATTTLATTTNHVVFVTPALTNGGLLIRAWVTPIATVTLSQLIIFRSPDSGTTRYIIGSTTMPAYTLAATTEVPRAYFEWSLGNPLVLSSADTLYAAAGVDTGDFHFAADVIAF